MAMQDRQAIRDHLIRSSRILIVDDAATDRMILRSFCNKAGFHNIVEASSAEEAWDSILATAPNLVFLDIEMAGMKGLELCAKLRKAGLLRQMVVIIQTASEHMEIKAKAFDAGATDLVTKPLHARETMARALAHLERCYLQRQDAEQFIRIQEELSEAVMLQSLLVPQEAVEEVICQRTGIDIAHYYHPASELAGDYLLVRDLPDGSVSLIAIDIAGHGLTAALYAFSMHSLLEDRLLAEYSPAQLLTFLNEKLLRFMSAGKFATALVIKVHPSRQLLEYASAASPMPLMWTRQGRVPFETRGHILGVDESAVYADHRISYCSGDRLLIYSDALLESVGTHGPPLSLDEVEGLLSRKTASASEHLRDIVAAFFERTGHQPQDDLSMVMCRF